MTLPPASAVVSPLFLSSCRSTRLGRTLISMRCVVAGMFPREHLPKGGDTVEVHVSKPEEEILQPNRLMCPFLTRFLDFDDYPEYVYQLQEKVKDMFGIEDVISIVPTDVTGGKEFRVDITRNCAFEALNTRKYHGITLTPALEELLEELTTLMPVEHAPRVLGPIETRSSIGYRAAVGPLCTNLINNLRLQRENKLQRLILFSSHDETLVYLLMVLDLFDQRWPVYGADVTLELLETEEGELLVRVLNSGHLVAEMKLEEMEERLGKTATTEEEYREICRL